MKGESRIALFSLDTGEIGSIRGRLPDDRFITKGSKLYGDGMLILLDKFTNTENKLIMEVFSKKHIDCNNILLSKVADVFTDIDVVRRSRLKRKLIDNMILQEYREKFMLNPYIFIPRGDLNVRNSKHLTQRVWKWLFQDKDTGSDEVIKHTERLFK